jgi:hypothetical protein
LKPIKISQEELKDIITALDCNTRNIRLRERSLHGVDPDNMRAVSQRLTKQSQRMAELADTLEEFYKEDKGFEAAT